VAPRLVLSIGHFEVSKMRKIDVEGVDDLIALRKETQPEGRHFFMKMMNSTMHIERPRLERCSTYGEALALQKLLESEPALRVMIISTDVHLRRVALTLSNILPDGTVDFRYCPVPSGFGFLTKEDWWTHPNDRWFVVKELVKLIGYRAILSTPAWATRRLMRLRNHSEYADPLTGDL
jgi:hypothetical protein